MTTVPILDTAVPNVCGAVIEHLSEAVIGLDAGGRVRYLNLTACALFGVTPGQAIGRPVDQVIGAAELATWYNSVTRTGIELVRGEGTSRHVYRLTLSPMGSNAPQGLERLLSITDITEQVRIRESLTHRSRQLSLLHDIARATASTLDLGDLYQVLADTLAQIIGGDGCYITRIDPDTGQVKPCAAYGPYRTSYVNVEPPAGAQTLTESVLAAGRPLAVEDVFQSPYISPGIAAMFPARSTLGVPLRVGQRHLGAVLFAFNDPHTFSDEEILWAGQAVDLAALAIENAALHARVKSWAAELEKRVQARTCELEETQAQLLHAEKLAAVGRLTAGIAHEISNPLTLIRGHVSVLAQQHPDLPQIAPIEAGIAKLVALLRQLVDFSRPAVGRRTMVDVNRVLQEVLIFAHHEVNRNRVQCQLGLSENLPAIAADGQQLAQVFLNLVLNACDAMPGGGDLHVSTAQEAGQVVVEFKDNGVGIAPDDLGRIFEPYFTTKDDKGTGLGLAICRRIVEAHAGRIEATSPPGAGAILRVYLPCQERLDA